MSAKKSFSVGEAADYLQLSRRIIYDAIKEGTLKSWRPYSRADQRINIDELHRWAQLAPVSDTTTAAA